MENVGADDWELDLTARLLDTLEDVLFVSRPNGGLLLWNRRLLEVTGRTRQDLAYLQPVDLVVEADQTRFAQALKQTADDGRFRVEAAIRRKGRSPLVHSFELTRIGETRASLVVVPGRAESDDEASVRQLQAATNQERRRVGRELHDGIASQLAGMAMKIDHTRSGSGDRNVQDHAGGAHERPPPRRGV